MQKKNSVAVNGSLLSSDRRALGLSVQALVNESLSRPNCIVISRSTIERAEKGQDIRISSLKTIASLLNQSHERYISGGGILLGSSLNVSGAWKGYAAEPDINFERFISFNEIEFFHEGPDIRLIKSVAHLPNYSYEETPVDCSIVHDMLMIRNYIAQWEQPSGISQSMLKLTRGNHMMEGYVTWYDLDTQKVEQSKKVLARCDSPYFEEYIQLAHNIVEDTIAIID